jgi:hypothetical protein
VIVGVMLAGFFGVILGVDVTPVGHVRLMTRLSVVATLVMLGGRFVMLSGMFVMFSSFAVMFRGFL